MTTCLQSTAHGVASQTSALQLIAITAASWNLIAPVRSRRRVRRIALRSLVRPSLMRPGLVRTGCGTVAGAA